MSVSLEATPPDPAVLAALRRQAEDPEDHDLSLIEECLRLTPLERLERLASWVNFVASARPDPLGAWLTEVQFRPEEILAALEQSSRSTLTPPNQPGPGEPIYMIRPGRAKMGHCGTGQDPDHRASDHPPAERYAWSLAGEFLTQ